MATIDLIDPFDDCEWLPARDLFRRLGFEPVPPAGLDNFQLRGRRWEFIYAMAGRRFYLHYTDHLGDRELYHWLYNQWIVEQPHPVVHGVGANYLISLPSAASGDFTRARKIIAAMTNGLKLAS